MFIRSEGVGLRDREVVCLWGAGRGFIVFRRLCSFSDLSSSFFFRSISAVNWS